MEVGNGLLINNDCLIAMDELIAQGVKVDAIITDPPY
jgi:DNA modification methylase